MAEPEQKESQQTEQGQSDLEPNSSSITTDNTKPPKPRYSSRFWLAFSGLCFIGLVSALDGSVVSTALPSIVADLSGAENYAWVVNVYFLTSAAFQPLYGQLADVCGRRYVMIGASVIFIFGSGLCGGASSMDMLIWGRAVQGIGAGGINMLIDMIICDLLPMRERGNFIGLLFLFVTIGTTVGPLIGGVLTEHASWRWVFYLNLPLGGVALLLLILFLQVKWKQEVPVAERMRQIDVVGNVLVACSTFSALWGLTYGGTKYTWSQAEVAVPVVLGFVGLAIFVAWESSPWCKYPVLKVHHFGSRTASAALFISFNVMILAFWTVYFYPVYLQALKGDSPTTSGLHLLPMEVTLPVFAALGGVVVSKTGRYKPVHVVASALLTLSLGLNVTLSSTSPKVAWAIFEILAGMGVGGLISTTLQAVQAGFPESEVASTTATWAYVRSLGTIWGVAIPSAVFNSRFDQLSLEFDPSIRDDFVRGQAYQHATAAFIQSLPLADQAHVLDAYHDALQRVWYVSIAFGAATLVAALCEKELKLRTELESEFGLGEKKEVKAQNEGDADKEHNRVDQER